MVLPKWPTQTLARCRRFSCRNATQGMERDECSRWVGPSSPWTTANRSQVVGAGSSSASTECSGPECDAPTSLQFGGGTSGHGESSGSAHTDAFIERSAPHSEVRSRARSRFGASEFGSAETGKVERADCSRAKCRCSPIRLRGRVAGDVVAQALGQLARTSWFRGLTILSGADASICWRTSNQRWARSRNTSAGTVQFWVVCAKVSVACEAGVHWRSFGTQDSGDSCTVAREGERVREFLKKL